MNRRILLDIETAPLEAYTWGIYEQTIPTCMVKRDWYILCWSAKDLDTGERFGDSLHFHKESVEPEKEILVGLHKLLCESQLVIAHNGVKFDRRKINARLACNGFTAPSPYKMYDTLLVAKRHFAFTSNRLDDLAKILGVPLRKKSVGWDLWERCIAGDTKAFEAMFSYNKRDVDVLEAVYKKLCSWSAPQKVDAKDRDCPSCGKPTLIKGGRRQTRLGTYDRYRCTSCGSWSQSVAKTKDSPDPSRLKVELA